MRHKAIADKKQWQTGCGYQPKPKTTGIASYLVSIVGFFAQPSFVQVVVGGLLAIFGGWLSTTLQTSFQRDLAKRQEAFQTNMMQAQQDFQRAEAKRQSDFQVKQAEEASQSQTRQLLFNARLTALKAYSAASLKYTDVVVKLSELSTRLLTAHSSQSAAIQAFGDYRKILDEFLKSRGEIGLAMLDIEVLFEIKPFSPQELGLKVFPNNFALLADEKERGRVISLLKNEVDMLQSEILNNNNQIAAYMEKTSKILRGNNP